MTTKVYWFSVNGKSGVARFAAIGKVIIHEES